MTGLLTKEETAGGEGRPSPPARRLLKIGLANFACGLAAEGSKGGGLKEGGQQRVGSGLGDGLKDGLKDGLGTASNGR
ncbi:hypothetical protein HXX76_001688 [Chlamydomonas incerta]|uniref:Uncharacterized protein n=1 Tax=Chlamydomonas incerta TaxID=51695 RepID=A0A836B1Q9_CHLIN|nr:hypothetical protein HXX76_001688 [Chlamydomonas incerta]|eukprot:KAG2444952.1 hypothetical protein HXX76_001688 [Chlamydomonas incerta]